MARFFREIGAAPDRGRNLTFHERERACMATLVEGGR